eukprot:1154125-Pelagomonas_calceolata.AAC.2
MPGKDKAWTGTWCAEANRQNYPSHNRQRFLSQAAKLPSYMQQWCLCTGCSTCALRSSRHRQFSMQVSSCARCLPKLPMLLTGHLLHSSLLRWIAAKLLPNVHSTALQLNVRHVCPAGASKRAYQSAAVLAARSCFLCYSCALLEHVRSKTPPCAAQATQCAGHDPCLLLALDARAGAGAGHDPCLLLARDARAGAGAGHAPWPCHVHAACW